MEKVELDGDQIMTLAEVAKMLRCSVRKVRKLNHSGILVPVVKLPPRGMVVRRSVVMRAIRMLEGEGYGPQNRIARVVPRHRA